MDDEPQLPEELQAFRRQARVNTYTVAGPGFILDDYPGAEGGLSGYPILFGVNLHRVRTIG
jgi:hypothetical protein